MTPLHTCPDLGRLRAWLDQPLSDWTPELTDHLEACPVCRATVRELREDAETAGAAIRALGPSAPPSPSTAELALRRFHRERAEASALARASVEGDARVSPKERRRMTVGMAFQRWRVALGGLAAALALTLLVGTPEGQSAAAAFLAQFRGERLTIIAVDPRGSRSPMFQLERLGSVRTDRNTRMEEVISVEEAARRTGLSVKQPDPSTVPAGLAKDPKISVQPVVEHRFTLERQKARAYLDSIGRKDLTVPEKLDGATLIVKTPATVFLHYQNPGSTSDLGLGIVQAGELTAGVEGKASLEEMREFLLDLPDLPPDLVRQLRGIEDWRNTLPIPVRADTMKWQATRVGGAEGFLLTETGGVGQAIIWQANGGTYGVVGAKADEIQRVANSLR